MSSENLSTRERILKSAWSLLGTGARSRMADIAKAAGISRQALYLHFPNRADLLIETVRYMDQVNDIDGRLRESRNADTGRARLDAFVTAWCNYIPLIQGVSRALRQSAESDAEAAAAWADRLAAIHHGCLAATRQLDRDNALAEGLSAEPAADLLAAILSVEGWEALVQRHGWTQDDYVAAMLRTARNVLID